MPCLAVVSLAGPVYIAAALSANFQAASVLLSHV